MTTFRRSYSVRTNRGGTFFTMVVFIMMLTSTALMYYYYQRTRSLERQLAAIQSGKPAASDSSSGLFAFLPWNNDNIERTAHAPAPEAAPDIQEASPEVHQAIAADDGSPGLPSTGAASTLRSGAVAGGDTLPALVEDEVPPYASVNLSSGPQEEPEILPDENQEAGNSPTLSTAGSASPADPETDADAGEVNSMYDAPPQVRVRAPRRN